MVLYASGDAFQFMLCRGRISFELSGGVDVIHQAIDEALKAYGFKPDIGREHDDIKRRLAEIEEVKRWRESLGLSSSFNSTTIMGNKIKSKGSFFYKVYPYVFEAACLSFWPGLIKKHSHDYDAVYGRITVDFKSKHRNVPPWHTTADGPMQVTVPEEQRKQNTNFYVFGQVRDDLSGGYINGVMRKDDFWSHSRLLKKEKGTRDMNGEEYVSSVYSLAMPDLTEFVSIEDAKSIFVNTDTSSGAE